MGRTLHRFGTFVVAIGIAAFGLVAFGAVVAPTLVRAAPTPAYQLTTRDSGSLSGRVFSAVAGAADDESVVLYGGQTPGSPAGVFADTWVYGPSTGWVAQCGSTAPGASAPCGPGPRASGGMARGATGPVLFGGSATGIDGGGAPRDDTWVWRDGGWTQVCGPGTCGPSGRLFPAFGGNGTQVVMFGGFSPTGLADDTWVFDGTTWTRTCGTGAPTPCGAPARVGATIGWDGEQFVMFGGAPMGSTDVAAPTDDTWTFNGTSWTHVCGTSIAIPCGPVARALAGMAFQRQAAPSQQGAVLVGGGNLFGGTTQSLERDAWLWRA